MPPQNYCMLPYEVDIINTNSLPITQMACMEVVIPRDILLDSLQITSSASSSPGNFVGAGLYSPRSLSLIVGFTFSFTPALATRLASLAQSFVLKSGVYIWAAGNTASLTLGVLQPNAYRATANLYGRSPVGVQVSASGLPPANLGSIGQSGAVTQMLVGILLGS